MPRFHRTRYTDANGRVMKASWWQIGDLIFRHRQWPA